MNPRAVIRTGMNLTFQRFLEWIDRWGFGAACVGSSGAHWMRSGMDILRTQAAGENGLIQGMAPHLRRVMKLLQRQCLKDRWRSWVLANLSLLVLTLLFCVGSCPGTLAADDGLRTVFPEEDSSAVLHNPDMGWVVYENYPVDPDPHGSSTMLGLPDEHFPDVDVVAVMFSWADIEKREGVYDFDAVDRAYDYWKKRGKSIQLRSSTESLVWWATRSPPAGTGIPEHVLGGIDPLQKQVRKMEGIPYVVVDARNVHYQRRLAIFLKQVAQHFARERPVTLVDLRGFGVWGEWHTGFQYPDMEGRRAGLKKVLDIWAAAFPDDRLALSYSYDPDGPKALYAGSNRVLDPTSTGSYPQFLRYSAFDHGLKFKNVTFRRDGCGGAVHSNERKLNEEAFRKGRAPMFSEFAGGYANARQGGSNWVTWVVEDALSLHPNYINLLGWQGGDARDFARERPDLVARGLRTMGYRLVPVRISYPRRIVAGKRFEILFEWQNRGVGRALRDFELQVFARGKAGALEVAGSQVLPTSRWVAGGSYTATYRGRFDRASDVLGGVSFVLRDPVSGRRIALPLKRAVGESQYPIGM